MKQRHRYLALKAERDQLQQAHDMAWAKVRELAARASELEAEKTVVEVERTRLSLLLSVLAFHIDQVISLTTESEGIAGWHLNGDLLKWDQVEGLSDLSEFVEWAKKRYGSSVVYSTCDPGGIDDYLNFVDAQHAPKPLPFEETPAPESDHAPDDIRIRPFSNGSQFGDWTASNCDRCKKYGECEIELALAQGYIGDGAISYTIASRMNVLPSDKLTPYVWPCPEVDWTDEWRAEVEARTNDR